MKLPAGQTTTGKNSGVETRLGLVSNYLLLLCSLPSCPYPGHPKANYATGYHAISQAHKISDDADLAVANTSCLCFCRRRSRRKTCHNKLKGKSCHIQITWDLGTTADLSTALLSAGPSSLQNNTITCCGYICTLCHHCK